MVLEQFPTPEGEPADEAALDALRPSAYQLCTAAQHALGLAALDSQIDLARITVQVRATHGLLLAFVGEGALWWVATMPSAALRAAVDRLLGEITESIARP